ncbi:MAG: hypothetical protein JSW58_01315 [Candidatus Latescibacterota bacterium]|nr:MAG: hypothetical protein JSW58_01315 [Candidatus Latescibacterota bacterium]
MLYHLLVAVIGVVGLVGVWLGVQALARRGGPEFGPESDVLACKTCHTPDACDHCVYNPDTDREPISGKIT